MFEILFEFGHFIQKSRKSLESVLGGPNTVYWLYIHNKLSLYFASMLLLMAFNLLCIKILVLIVYLESTVLIQCVLCTFIITKKQNLVYVNNILQRKNFARKVLPTWWKFLICGLGFIELRWQTMSCVQYSSMWALILLRVKSTMHCVTLIEACFIHLVQHMQYSMYNGYPEWLHNSSAYI